MRGTQFLCHELAPYVGQRVLLEGNRRIAALLRAIMHEPVLTDVQITGSRTATPLVRTSLCDIVLKAIDTREAALLKRLHRVVDRARFFVERLQLSIAIVNDANGRAEAQLGGPPSNGQR